MFTCGASLALSQSLPACTRGCAQSGASSPRITLSATRPRPSQLTRHRCSSRRTDQNSRNHLSTCVRGSAWGRWEGRREGEEEQEENRESDCNRMSQIQIPVQSDAVCWSKPHRWGGGSSIRACENKHLTHTRCLKNKHSTPWHTQRPPGLKNKQDTYSISASLSHLPSPLFPLAVRPMLMTSEDSIIEDS